MSEKGIVALEFSSMHTAMEDALCIRFPEAEQERSHEELANVMEVVTGVIDDPATDCELPLDLRGTPYEIQVWMMLREIPAGQTTNYGALAAKLGSRDPRDVTPAITPHLGSADVLVFLAHLDGTGREIFVRDFAESRLSRRLASDVPPIKLEGGNFFAGLIQFVGTRKPCRLGNIDSRTMINRRGTPHPGRSRRVRDGGLRGLP